MQTSRKLWTVYRFHRICCFFIIRFATISLTADSTNPLSCPVALSIIGHGIGVQFQIADRVRKLSR
jgi:hypothetical protein